MTYTFDLLRSAVLNCTSFDLIMVDNEETDEYEYYLIDGCGDQYGEAFHDLDDVADFISNNEEVDQYLTSAEVYG